MKPTPTDQKLRGGYYTPKPIADFLARWAVQTPDAKILEPSCGDGNLLVAAIDALVDCGLDRKTATNQVYGVEINPQEAARARERTRLPGELLSTVAIHEGDFFEYCQAHLSDKQLFDAVIGNPPFIRYQNFPERHRAIAFDLMRKAGLNPNKLTNTWVPFLVATTLLLSERGRMAMVVPAELLQVNYAAQLRCFLSEYYSDITLITFKKLVFEGLQQEVVLLLGQKNGHQTDIRAIELDGLQDLQLRNGSRIFNAETKTMDHSTEKWTMYFLDNREIGLLRELKAHPRLTLARDVIEVDVGIVTGFNKFFVLTKQDVENLDLDAFMSRMVSRSTYLRGAIFSETDWQQSADRQAPAYLLNLPDVPFELLAEPLKTYIRSGENASIHTGYKCRIRKRWYVVPSVWTPEAFMLRQVHQYPKIILNSAGATCTDTIHRVKFRNGASGEMVSAAFLNALTFAFSEVIGRSYGGGVLELEPNEAERLPLPLTNAEQLELSHLDSLIRANNLQAVLDITDRFLLREGLGLSLKEIKLLRGIWEKLRDRRINRKPEH